MEFYEKGAINAKMMKVTRKINKLKDTYVTFVRLLTGFSYKTSFYYILKSIFFRKNTPFGKKLHRLQYESIKNVLIQRYGDIVARYSNISKPENNAIDRYKNIWLIWWQGIDSSTPKHTIENIKQIKRLNPDWNVTVVSKYNYKKFVHPRSRIIEYAEKGRISLPHISDYIRVLLLKEQGGVYIDVNFFALKPFDTFAQFPFYTIKHGLFSDFHICKGLWHTGLMAAYKNNPLYCFVADMYNAYLDDYDFIPSYFFIDALISIGYENIPAIRTEIDNVPYNNKYYNFINENGNSEYDKDKWNELLENTCFYNVSHKKTFIKVTDDKKETYFSHLYSYTEQKHYSDMT